MNTLVRAEHERLLRFERVEDFQSRAAWRDQVNHDFQQPSRHPRAIYTWTRPHRSATQVSSA